MSKMEETVTLLEDINKLVNELFTVKGANKTLTPIEFTELLQKQSDEIEHYSSEAKRLQKKVREANQTISDLKIELDQKSKMVDARPLSLARRHSDNELMIAKQESLQQLNRINELEDQIKALKIKNYELVREKGELKEHSRQRSMALHNLEDDRVALRKELQTKNDQDVQLLRREVELLKMSARGQDKDVVDRLRKEILDTHKALMKTQEERDNLAYEISTKRKATQNTQKELDKEFRAERMSLMKKISSLETSNNEIQWENNKKKEELMEADTAFQELRQKYSSLELSFDSLIKENTFNKNKVSELGIQLEKLEKSKKTFIKRGDKRLSAKESRMDTITNRKLNQTDKVLKGYQNELKKLIEKLSGVCGSAKKVLEKKEHKDMLVSLDEVNTIAENLFWKMGVP